MTNKTPRTDALMRPNGALATNLLEHARQIERELTTSEYEVEILRLKLKRAIIIGNELGIYVGWPITAVKELIIELQTLKP